MFKMMFTHVQLLRYAGLFTWGCVGVLLLFSPLRKATPLAQNASTYLWLSYAVFGSAYWWLTRAFERPQFVRTTVLLAAMTMASLAITHFTQSGLAAILLMVNAGVIAWLLPLKPAIFWMVGQNLAMLPVFAVQERFSWLEALLQVGLYLGCSSFIFMTALIAKRQSEAREALREVNLELLATQAMLSETERTAERLRISRELHDLVGHHLTALSLNLEVATHLTTGKAREHVKQAQSISKLLLSDVREVVSTLREGDPMNLDHALKRLVEGVPQPHVHLTLPQPFTISDAARANVVLRLTQEILTNTIKHARARNLWLSFTLRDGGVEISAHDDGRGAEAPEKGNGLSGMTERLAMFGGTLLCQTEPGRGFNVAAHLPLEVRPVPQP